MGLLISMSGRDGLRSASAVALHARHPAAQTGRKAFLCTARRKEARFTLLKGGGNDLVKRGCFQEALLKYSECLTLKPEECALYTNRCHRSTAPPLGHFHMIILR